MQVSLTPQLLGDLIEKGYSYMLANTVAGNSTETTIVLKPVRKKPSLLSLPNGYEAYYRITREPMQLACGVDATTVLVDYETISGNITGEDIFEDSYFRMSEDFFKQVLDSLEDYAVITTDKNGDVNSWNHGAQHVLGYSEHEIIGHSAQIFFTPQDREKRAPEKELSTALKDGRAVDERFHLRKDGSQFWGSGLVFPLYDEEEKHRGYTKIMRNLREEREARKSTI
ncbi:PAS domain S-box protein [Mucilaginibacter pallidiroseus]|uniref:PAS domain S-box protein n=1 Tax=Mucilaginibacter pallidiroseus TaxID=2599295 RepID=A0A563UGG8_9SPHI|nr:PAS domain S-box protein [Mucilaginibacter pallidiroseus]TWR30447.1 PAS domain S-box protein [Mucilaginibacter pallidiroseus]